MRGKIASIALLAALAGLTTQVSAADATRLGSTLTANGADPSGSADGMILAFTGGITKPPAGYVAGGDHIDPFAADKPLFTITVQNMAQYESRLSAGQKALLASKAFCPALRRLSYCAIFCTVMVKSGLSAANGSIWSPPAT